VSKSLRKIIAAKSRAWTLLLGACLNRIVMLATLPIGDFDTALIMVESAIHIKDQVRV